MGSIRWSRRSLLGLAIGLLAVVAGCRTYGVRSDWDPTAAFDTMRRFHFEAPREAEDANPFADNTLLRKRLRHAIVSALTERGYVEAPDRAEADFVATYRVLLEDEMRVDGMTTGGGALLRPYGVGAVGYTTTSVRSHQEATLLIDVLVPETGDLAWRGWGQGMLTTRDRDRSAERLADGVRAILRAFPPERD